MHTCVYTHAHARCTTWMGRPCRGWGVGQNTPSTTPEAPLVSCTGPSGVRVTGLAPVMPSRCGFPAAIRMIFPARVFWTNTFKLQRLPTEEGALETQNGTAATMHLTVSPSLEEGDYPQDVKTF